MSTKPAQNKPKRRHYPDELKLKLIQLALKPGATVKQIAQEYQISPDLLRKWVIAHQQQSLVPAFTPVKIQDQHSANHTTNEPISIQVKRSHTEIALSLQICQVNELGILIREVLN